MIYTVDLDNGTLLLPHCVQLLMEVSYKKALSSKLPSVQEYILWKQNMEPHFPRIQLQLSLAAQNWVFETDELEQERPFPRLLYAATQVLPLFEGRRECQTPDSRLWALGWFLCSVVNEEKSFCPPWLRMLYASPGTFPDLPMAFEALWHYRSEDHSQFSLNSVREREQYCIHCLALYPEYFPQEDFASNFVSAQEPADCDTGEGMTKAFYARAQRFSPNAVETAQNRLLFTLHQVINKGEAPSPFVWACINQQYPGADPELPLTALVAGYWHFTQNMPYGSLQGDRHKQLYALGLFLCDFYANHTKLAFPDWVQQKLQAPSPELPLAEAKECGLSVFLHALYCFRHNGAHTPPPTSKTQMASLRRFAQSVFSEDELHAFIAPWQTAAWSRRHPKIRSNFRPQVNILGWPDALSGIGEDARATTVALQSVGAELCHVDLRSFLPFYGPLQDVPYEMVENPCYPQSVVCLAAQDLLKLYQRAPAHWWSDFYTIGLCPWELPEWPQKAKLAVQGVHELWAPSTFVQKAFAHAGRPVRYVPHCILPLPEQGDMRDMLGISRSTRVFLTVFDSASSMQRKNPEAVLQAFCTAFTPQDDVLLVVKSMNCSKVQSQWATLQNMNTLSEKVLFLDAKMSRTELVQLLRTCDVFVSLHRAEGFGRLLAEAMLLGKLLVCSEAGGSSDFAYEKTALCVSGKNIPVPERGYLFGQGQQWFDVHFEDAVKKLRYAAKARPQLEALARAGQKRIKRQHSPEAVGKIMLESLFNNA